MSVARRLSVAVPTALAAAAMLWAGTAVSNAALGIGAVASAQDTGGSTAHRGQAFAKMLMSLRPPLTDEQKAHIRQMRDDMRKQYANQPPPADPAARRARFEAFLGRIRGTLNPAQQRDFDAKMAEMRARHNQGQH